jgi:hypothetical protein
LLLAYADQKSGQFTIPGVGNSSRLTARRAWAQSSDRRNDQDSGEDGPSNSAVAKAAKDAVVPPKEVAPARKKST